MNAEDLRVTLDKHTAWLRGDPNDGERANLRGAYLRGANLRGANLRDANLRDANLGDANLGDANLRGANLRGANLRGAYLGDANLRDANLRGAYLGGANLGDAYLGGANLGGANLGGAYLRDADGIAWACYGPVGQCPSLVQGWWDGVKLVVAGGCFLGSADEFRAKIVGTPWDWSDGSDADRERWRAECTAAIDMVEATVARQVADGRSTVKGVEPAEVQS